MSNAQSPVRKPCACKDTCKSYYEEGERCKQLPTDPEQPTTEQLFLELTAVHFINKNNVFTSEPQLFIDTMIEFAASEVDRETRALKQEKETMHQLSQKWIKEKDERIAELENGLREMLIPHGISTLHHYVSIKSKASQLLNP